MSRLRTIAAVALAALWVVAGSHCLLESVLGFSFLHCDPPQSSSSTPESHCNDEACQTMEAGHYLPSAQVTAPVAALGIVLFEPVSLAERSISSENIMGVLTAAPPDLPASWQFSLRAAQPPRAPSFVS